MMTTNVDAESIKNVLESLTLLNDQREEIERKDAELIEAKEKLEKEQKATYGDTKPSDVLHLNVGGRHIGVLRRTLTSVEGSMLASRFSGRWDDSIEKYENGHFFIDQNFVLFETMVDYLRNKANEIPSYPVISPDFSETTQRKDFFRMVEYYGMTHGIYPVALASLFPLLSSGKDSSGIIGPLAVDAKEFSTFELSGRHYGHSRRVRSIEVTIYNAQRVQIGWRYPKLVAGRSDVAEKDYIETYSIEDGIGDTSNSVSIDFVKSYFLCEGKRTDISRVELKVGSVVRLENYGSEWFVDGKLIASINSDHSGVFKVVQPDILKRCRDREYYIKPVISIKGQAKVSAIEYDTGIANSISSGSGYGVYD